MRWRVQMLWCGSLLGLAAVNWAQEPSPAPSTVTHTPAPAATAPAEASTPSDSTNEAPAQTAIAEQTLRSFLQIQGQLDTALLAIERSRRETDATSHANQKKIDDGLKSIEKSLQVQQEREILTLRESNRNLLIVAGAFAGVGFLTMLLTSWFHLRSMNRLAGIASALPVGHNLPPTSPALLGGETEALLASTTSLSGQRLLSAIERLEKRVIELEHNPQAAGAASLTVDVPTLAHAAGPAPAPTSSVSVLLGKGQTLLNLGKAQEALQCFDQALELQPRHAETLVKKGTALEKLNRLDEAIDCYDQAIAANQSMTLAYLYKGGVFNRLERYTEALACYEQALRSQSTSAVPEPEGTV